MLCWLHGGPTDQSAVTFLPAAGVLARPGMGRARARPPRVDRATGAPTSRRCAGRWGELDVTDTIAWLDHAVAARLGAARADGARRRVGRRLHRAARPRRRPGRARRALSWCTRSPTSPSCAARSHRFEAHYTDTLVGTDPATSGGAIRARRPPSPRRCSSCTAPPTRSSRSRARSRSSTGCGRPAATSTCTSSRARATASASPTTSSPSSALIGEFLRWRASSVGAGARLEPGRPRHRQGALRRVGVDARPARRAVRGARRGRAGPRLGGRRGRRARGAGGRRRRAVRPPRGAARPVPGRRSADDDGGVEFGLDEWPPGDRQTLGPGADRGGGAAPLERHDGGRGHRRRVDASTSCSTPSSRARSCWRAAARARRARRARSTRMFSLGDRLARDADDGGGRDELRELRAAARPRASRRTASSVGTWAKAVEAAVAARCADRRRRRRRRRTSSAPPRRCASLVRQYV